MNIRRELANGFYRRTTDALSSVRVHTVQLAWLTRSITLATRESKVFLEQDVKLLEQALHVKPEPSQACSRRSCSELSTVKRALTETAQVHFQLCVCLSAQTAQFSVPVHISCGPGQWTQTTVAAYSFQRCWLKRREMRAARPYSSGTCAALGSRLLA